MEYKIATLEEYIALWEKDIAQGHISRLVKMGEDWAKEQGYKYATIGANAKNTRNTTIYLHFGYNEFVMHQHFEDGTTVLYYKKEL